MAKIAMIWAQDRNRALGTGTAMAWRVPADSRFFKDTTFGFPVIMGRSSWEALGCKPLPGRLNLVLSRQSDYPVPGGKLAGSLPEAIEVASASSDLVWIAGGAKVYAEAMEFADELVVTDLDLEVSGRDHLVYAPLIDTDLWEVDEQRSDVDWRDRSGDARWRVTYYRRRPNQEPTAP